MIKYLTKIEVGEYYQVPCIKTKYGTYPVIPFKHADPQLGTEASAMQHYHIDGRFLSAKEVKKILTLNNYYEKG